MRKPRALAHRLTLLALACGCTLPTYAVDVDRISVHSRRGEPLLAEIPIVDASPADLRTLQAQLASATTFARIGLERPSGVLTDLRFEVVTANGKPKLRISSQQPVSEPFLTFLLQVEWAQGKLVREYALSLHAEDSLPALAPQVDLPIQAEDDRIIGVPETKVPAVSAPQAADPARIEATAVTGSAGQADAEVADRRAPDPRPAAPIPLAGATRAPTSAPASKPQATAPPIPAQTHAATAPTSTRVAPIPVKERQAAPVRSPVATVAAATPPPPGQGSYQVRRGDNLTQVVKRMGLEQAGMSQSMLALLRTNPQAFGHGNINLLQRDAVLLAPNPQELTRLSAAEAEALVHRQIEQWRSGHMPPAALQEAFAPAATAKALAWPSAPDIAARSQASAQAAAARLEIAPAATTAHGSAGGGATGGGADDPEVAAADAVANRYTQVQQMRARIAELEARARAQQQLLQLKDRQLAQQSPTSGGPHGAWLVAVIAVLVAAFALLRKPRALITSRRQPLLQTGTVPGVADAPNPH